MRRNHVAKLRQPRRRTVLGPAFIHRALPRFHNVLPRWKISLANCYMIHASPLDFQAVVEASAGTFVMQFHSGEAPNHVRKFLELARQGYYNGTAFHTMVTHGVVQGGDPETRNAANRNRFGSGGFDMGLKPEALN